jgi:hypothetical protein
MDDDVAGDLTKDDLAKAGFVTGNAIKFLKAFAALSLAPTAIADAASASPTAGGVAAKWHHRMQKISQGGAAGGGGSAAVHAVPPPHTSFSPPTPPVPPSSLANSNFKREYDLAECPELQHELFSSMHSFIALMCDRHSVPPAAGKDLFHRLQGESFENPQELLSQIQVAATRIWTSTQKLQGAGVPKAVNVEFCSLLNRALRDDSADVMPHLVVIVRAINALCIVRRDASSLKFPPNAVSHRGGALPLQHHGFFTPGAKYRVPMYLATSFSEDKAYEFW